eukprot:m.74073 g.74073  ORF g.74073 m.74073 type:complete len:246 (-) comp12387_c0_seq4:2273-3010(-)
MRSALVLDTRSASVVGSHRSRHGGGVEEYSLLDVRYGGVMPWQNLKESFDKLLEATRDVSLTHATFLQKVEVSGWLDQISQLMRCATFTAKTCREERKAVVVHGSVGADTTSSTVSLAQLMLDPHFRTRLGFAQLIEKEWLHMGHPFGSRNGTFRGSDPRLVAPSFLLFLDAVHQLRSMFPFMFEFNDLFLMDLHTASACPKTGTHANYRTVLNWLTVHSNVCHIISSHCKVLLVSASQSPRACI